jgi:hypothetical protein
MVEASKSSSLTNQTCPAIYTAKHQQDGEQTKLPAKHIQGWSLAMMINFG